MHDIIPIGIPLIAILAGILFSRNDIQELRSEIRGEMKDLCSDLKNLRSEIRVELQNLRSEMRTRFDLVDAELSYFYGTVSSL